MSEFQHNDLCSAVLAVADALDGKGKSLHLPAPPSDRESEGEECGRILDDAQEEWLLDALDALEAAAENNTVNEDWKRRCINLAELVSDGDLQACRDAVDMADAIIKKCGKNEETTNSEDC